MNTQQASSLGWVSFVGSMIGMGLLIYVHICRAAILCAEPSTLFFSDHDENKIAILFIAGIAILVPSTLAGLVALWPVIVAQAAQSQKKTSWGRVLASFLFFGGLVALMMFIYFKIVSCEMM